MAAERDPAGLLVGAAAFKVWLRQGAEERNHTRAILLEPGECGGRVRLLISTVAGVSRLVIGGQERRLLARHTLEAFERDLVGVAQMHYHFLDRPVILVVA